MIRSNYKAFQYTHGIICFGFIMSILSTILFQFHLIGPFYWFLMATTGLYLGYVPYNCLYFERLLATYKIQGNVGFVMYIADAFGYLGTVIVLLIKEFVNLKYSWVNFFTVLFLITSITGIVLILWGAKVSARIYKSFEP